MNPDKFQDIVSFIRKAHNKPSGPVPLHDPVFIGNEKKYLMETIDSTYVSSVGPFVTKFEESLKEITGSKFAIAIVNGTCALHLALILAGVESGDEVITQPFTFVATVNAIMHANAVPHFVDIDIDTLGLSPSKLRAHLNNIAVIKDGKCYNKLTGNRISCCVPMHTFGLPLRIVEVIDICKEYGIPVVEDSTEGMGSYFEGKHVGTFGLLGTFSFNGNKTVTSGSGGAIITNNEKIAQKAKHLSTTAKVPHKWAFIHDEVGYNYRMSNLNAALACAQLEQLPVFLENKRELSSLYSPYFKAIGVSYVEEMENSKSNYWLNTILLENENERDVFLQYSHDNQVYCRPAWTLMTKLQMYRNSFCGDIKNSEHLEARVVNIPSSVRTK